MPLQTSSSLPAPSPEQPSHLVFVYGTLKGAHRNHACLHLSTTESVLVDGAARTRHRYPLRVEYGLPFITKEPGLGHRVRGELWAVGDYTLSRLDGLESHPYFYCRELTEISISTGKVVKAWLYFLNTKSAFSSKRRRRETFLTEYA